MLPSIMWLIICAVAINFNCPVSIYFLSRLVYNCTNRHFERFPTNIPNNTLVLFLRRTMSSPIIPSFHTIGLEKLQVLDLSYNNIQGLSNDAFKDMTSLLTLDIRGNSFFAEHVPNGIFKYLINLNTLKIRGWDFSYETSKLFVEETRFFKSLESFMFDVGEVELITLFTSQYINLTSFSIIHCSHNDLPLSLVLLRLRNLKKT